MPMFGDTFNRLLNTFRKGAPIFPIIPTPIMETVPAPFDSPAGTVLIRMVTPGVTMASQNPQAVVSGNSIVMGPGVGLNGYYEPGRFTIPIGAYQ